MAKFTFWFCLPFILVWSNWAAAQEIRVATVEREPFSMVVDGVHTGFSIDLMNQVASSLGWSVVYEQANSFGGMLGAVEIKNVDAAIANISVTADRERRMDFSQPIFDSGIQVMLPASSDQSNSVFSALFTRDIGLAVTLALALLFGGGMLMWLFERRAQPYFDRPLKEAPFPAFWWALNLVVNGGFEERMPQSRPGRIFAVILVISSLFIVSIFVAQITASMTIKAINDNVQGLNDLDGRRVGTINGSTSAAFLDARQLPHIRHSDTKKMFDAFEEGNLDAVVFDGPILAYYVAVKSSEGARLTNRVYKPENYAAAFPTDSALREQFDQVLLGLRETGEYDELVQKWFGQAYRND